MRLIGLATGSFYRWTNDMNKAIAICKRFDIDGVEITIAYQSTLTKLKLNKDNINYLKELKFNTIHAPMKGIIYRKNPKTRKTIYKIEEIYRKMDAKNVIFHPHKIENPYYLKKSDMQVSIENMTAFRKVTINKIGSILNQNPNFSFVLDVCHAATYSPQKTREYVDKFKNKIAEIHLSYFKDGAEHQPIHYCDKSYFEAIKIIKKIDAPIVIENRTPPKRYDIVKNDINFVKEHLMK